jgi:hypothetical protein
MSKDKPAPMVDGMAPIDYPGLGKSNNPPVILELPKELAEFIVTNCDANITFALQFLQQLKSRDLQEQMVANIEKFKQLLELTTKALKQ